MGFFHAPLHRRPGVKRAKFPETDRILSIQTIQGVSVIFPQKRTGNVSNAMTLSKEIPKILIQKKNFKPQSGKAAKEGWESFESPARASRPSQPFT